jgi:hypothetical protein
VLAVQRLPHSVSLSSDLHRRTQLFTHINSMTVE